MNLEEFSFIESIRQPSYKQPSLIKGIGDDAAVIRNSSQDLVTAVDTFAEGIHFLPSTMTPFDIGYKALAANISDLAAMGATPAFYLVSIAISKNWTTADVQEIFKGMRAIGNSFNMDLIGGDTISSESLVLSVTVMGYVNKDKARYRNSAKPGDVVFATGTLGDSQAGLHLLFNPEELCADRSYFVKRHQQPSPRVLFAEKLSVLQRVTLNDISDGIASEANEIAEASQVDIHLNYEQLPVHSGMKAFNVELKDKWILSGGEDFELLGTVSPDAWAYVKDSAAATGTEIKEIGSVSQCKDIKPSVRLLKNNNEMILQKSGYNHFK